MKDHSRPPSNKKTLRFVSFLLLFATISFGLQISIPQVDENYETVMPGKVIEENSVESNEGDGVRIEQTLTLQINGESETIQVQNSDLAGPDARLFKEGDKVFISKIELPQTEPIYNIQDFDRRTPLYFLFGLLCFLVVLVSGRQGFESFLGMLFSFMVLFKWVLPLLLNGVDPLLATLSGAALIIPGTFYLSHGFERKTHIAILGTLISLALTGILSKIFVPLSQLSGLADEAAFYLKVGSEVPLDFRGLLLAGILISLLGILDDISISQASIAEELRAAKPDIEFKELYSRCMKVGRDHIAAMVNTLILVYAGGSLPLMLLFFQGNHAFTSVINVEIIAQELVHTFIGSIGLICAVPITTLLACIKPKKG